MIPFLFDLGMLAYGTIKNEYFYTFLNMSRVTTTIDTPYAKRANRIFQMNQGG